VSAFAVLAATGPVPAADPARRLRRLALPVEPAETVLEDGFAAAAGAHPLRPLAARRGALVAIGDVRLDDRASVAKLGGPVSADASDLELVLAAFETRGEAIVPALLGDFGFVVWNGRTRRLVAARDAFGVKPLFHSSTGGRLRMASRLEALVDAERFDEGFVADFLLGGGVDPERTLWADVRPVPPGGLLVWEGGKLSISRFWRADDFAPAEDADPREAAERFRALFAEAVRARLTGGADAWSQLSGGLDSSSVVSMAQHLASTGQAPAGLGGTLTMVDTLGDGDETRFSNAVAERWKVRNETLVDPWPWEDDGVPPVATDEPRPHYPFWTRDRRLCDLVRRGGGRVLLSGQGSDHYLDGPLTYTADLLSRGRVGAAVAEVTRHAVAERQSFWGMFARDALVPALPRFIARRLSRDAGPAWIDGGFARRMGVEARAFGRRGGNAPRGRAFATHGARALDRLPHFVERGPYAEVVEMRYPFLHRPLVEFGLTLPVRLRVRPGASKWVLREGMRGILPDAVRERRGKGGIDSRVLWALQREAPRLRELLRDPLVAQHGWVRGDALRDAAEAARCGQVDSLAYLLCTLSLETWLVVRSGRWNPGMETENSAASAA
jgi:asparagine synthase (glutamine-hydrolysing)